MIIQTFLPCIPFFAIAQQKERPKIEHAEPLYIDLIRDLGARKGEKEWNFAFGLTDKRKYDNYQALVEYEFAPADRLGLEFEVPVTFYTAAADRSSGRSSKIESFKSAIQWTFLVSEKYQSSFALGYINEILLTDFDNYGKEPLVSGNLFNPFLVMAKRLGAQFHSLVYTGPRIERAFRSPAWNTSFEINTSFHYMVPNTRNFVGIEFNKDIDNEKFNLVARPQMRVSIADNLLIGIVTGVPLMKEEEKLSSFLRLIWEPGHRH
ncbi:phosphoribosylformylglycinamidine synthase [Olivibacter sp. SDN3]|nr:phosphoribosylformylglycinamidine synthase [Olivibacter sp. SDN3]